MRVQQLSYLLALLVVMLPTQANACIVRYRPAEELKGEANLVVVATIVSRGIKNQSLNGELYEYEVRVREAQLGDMRSVLRIVTYYNLRARERNGVVECPLKDGSGIETNLRIGSEYRLYLRSDEGHEVLYSEQIGVPRPTQPAA